MLWEEWERRGTRSICSFIHACIHSFVHYNKDLLVPILARHGPFLQEGPRHINRKCPKWAQRRENSNHPSLKKIFEHHSHWGINDW